MHGLEVLFDKLIVVHLAKKLQAIYETQKFRCRVHESPPLALVSK